MKHALQKWVKEVPIAHATMLMGKGILTNASPVLWHVQWFGKRRGGKRGHRRGGYGTVHWHAFYRYPDGGFTHQLTQAQTIEVQPHAARVGMSGLPVSLCLTRSRRWWLSANSMSTIPRQSLTAVSPSRNPRARSLRRISGAPCKPLFARVTLFLPTGDVSLWCDRFASAGRCEFYRPAAVGLHWLHRGVWCPNRLSRPARHCAHGDGAAQLTIQELGSMLRDKQHPIIPVLNNEGYTVEGPFTDRNSAITTLPYGTGRKFRRH